MADLARRIAAEAPGCDVAGATLAMPGALKAAVRDAGLIYPMFMAEGWFTARQLPKKLAEAGAPGLRILPPFGTDPALPGLIAARARTAAEAEGWRPEDTTLLLSAHGSQVSQASFTITTRIAALVAPHFARIVTGFVEQQPFIAEAARRLTRAISLPLFALTAEHVTGDLPAALDRAGFTGPRLAPIGAAPEVPALIATALRAEILSLK